MRLRFLRDAFFEYGTANGVVRSSYKEGDVTDVPLIEAHDFLSHGFAETAGEEKAIPADTERAIKPRTLRKKKED
jgi:hypothetical protein